MIVQAYQTLANRDVHSIETNAPFKCERRGAWLGHGYYFWDSEIRWAHDWGRLGYSNDYKIITCKIKIDPEDDCFDLVGYIPHRQLFAHYMNLLKKTMPGMRIVVRHVLDLMELEIPDFKQKYKVIRASHTDDKSVVFYSEAPGKSERTTIGDRTQICVIDKKV